MQYAPRMRLPGGRSSGTAHGTRAGILRTDKERRNFHAPGCLQRKPVRHRSFRHGAVRHGGRGRHGFKRQSRLRHLHWRHTRANAPGRVGDSPIIGSGGYADNELGAASSTGYGESILRVMLCKTACDLLHSETPMQAAEQSMDILKRRGHGYGGVIMLSPDGRYGFAHSTPAHGLCLRRRLVPNAGIHQTMIPPGNQARQWHEALGFPVHFCQVHRMTDTTDLTTRPHTGGNPSGGHARLGRVLFPHHVQRGGHPLGRTHRHRGRGRALALPAGLFHHHLARQRHRHRLHRTHGRGPGDKKPGAGRRSWPCRCSDSGCSSRSSWPGSA